VIQYPEPIVDGGRYPAKRCAGDTVTVSADAFRDGHDLIRAVVRYRAPGARTWREAELHRIDAHLGGVRWVTEITLDRLGRWHYTIEAWTDVFGTWRDELGRKVAAGQHDLKSELSEGIVLLQAAAERARAASSRGLIAHAIQTLLDDSVPESAKHDVALGPELFAAVESDQEREGRVRLDKPIAIEVDRERAKFGAWYELFPRSWGGLRGVQAQLPRLAELGFDVAYLPPIHPIGLTNRKGRNNALSAEPDDPGSPWAIGDASGGHDAIHPDLGTLADMRALTSAASEHGIDIALDFAIQCSADHPWLTEHPGWFHRRPDGTLKYAENPPKRYQDIYNVNFDSEDWRGLWKALRGVVLFWAGRGVRIFRVDNPHTKPVAFWEWLIREVRGAHPDVVFLAEAFTTPARMVTLAKAGFSQSYTHFTWKNTKAELTEFLRGLTESALPEFYRPNFFVNTPDILHAYLQQGGRPAFEARLVLAATLSPSYGIYSGYEHFENVPLEAGSEEYLDSEKYELKQRALDGPLLPLVQRLNRARRENAALRRLENLTLLETANESLIAYAKREPENSVIVCVNLDPHAPGEGLVTIPPELGLPPTFGVKDVLTGNDFVWKTGGNYVALGPGQAHLLRVAAR